MRNLHPMIQTFATIALALAGGSLAHAIDTPLPWMLGALVATGTASFLGLRIAGDPLHAPGWLRQVFVPVIGVAIGATVTPEVLENTRTWWPSLIAVVPFVVIVQYLNYLLLRRVGGYDPATAFFAASPGGLVEAVLTGERNGGNVPVMATQHFIRVTLTVAALPILLTLFADHGTATGSPLTGGDPFAFPPVRDGLLLAAAAILGTWAAPRLRLPASVLIGPFLASAILHSTGITDAAVPRFLVAMAQMVIGMTLGLRFVDLDKRAFLRGLALAAPAVTVGLAVAALFTAGLRAFVDAPSPAVFLALAPGGVAEMSLISVSFGLDPAFVATHHILRIFVSIALPPVIFRVFIIGQTGAGADTGPAP